MSDPAARPMMPMARDRATRTRLSFVSGSGKSLKMTVPSPNFG